MFRLLLKIGLVLLLIGTLATSITFVQPGERAVVRRFGKVLADKPGAGLNLSWPWGIDRIDRVKVSQVRTVIVGFVGKETDDDSPSLPPGQLLTGDHNLVNVRAEINYRVIEAEVENFVLNGERRTEALIARATESALAEWLAGHRVDDVLLQGKTALREFLVERVQEWIKDYQLGIQIEQASVPMLNPPRQVSKDFDAVAEEHTHIQTRKYEAEQRADARKRTTEAEVFQIERRTSSYVLEQQLSAQAEAANFRKRFEQYQTLKGKDPDDYLRVLWQEEITRLYAQMRQTGRLDLLDHHIGADGLNIMQFPLPKKK